MKKSLLICSFLVLKLAGAATAAVVVDTDWSVGAAIPDGSPVGITTSEMFQNLSGAPITSVSVDLNISGGYNGDLYANLVLQDANGNVESEILLNRVGTSPSDPFGSAGSGFNVTLSDSGTANGSIHNATGNPTGTWLADSAISLDSAFGGLTANGTWTLFIVDESGGGGPETLNSWGLDIEVAAVPEPSNTGFIVAMGGLVVVGCGGLMRRRTQANIKGESV